MGSGSTGIAALNLNRNFIGVEIDQNYFDKASKRLEKTYMELIKNEKNIIRSPLYYLGDKYKLLPQILKYFPNKINKFFDVFGGGGTLLANVNANEYFYNDINKPLTKLLNFFYTTDPSKILEYIYIYEHKLIAGNKGNTSKNKENYNQLKNEYNNLSNKHDFHAHCLLFLLIIFGFNSQIRFNSNGNFNIPIGKQDLNENRKKIFLKFTKNLQSKKITFTSNDFQYIKKLVENGQITLDDFLYFDPPYLITNATYNSIWTAERDKQLLELLDFLNNKNIKWALSNVFECKGFKNEYLIEWAKKYKIYHLNSNYSNSNYQRKNKNEKVDEVLIIDYEN